MLRYSTLPYHTIPKLRIVPCRVEPDSLAYLLSLSPTEVVVRHCT